MEEEAPSARAEAATLVVRAENERIEKLEGEVALLRSELEELKREMAQFRSQFE
jgi:predicted RNase H-like nuclease (RuvC/YqgF family)